MDVASPLHPAVRDESDKDQEGGAGEVEEVEEEYVLLDLEDVFHGAALPANCPYTLSGLDTMNPILTLGDGGLKLIGEYLDTIGTSLIFTEKEEEVPSEGPVHPHEASSSLNSSHDTKRRIDSLCRVEKKLKFRIMNITEQEHISPGKKSEMEIFSMENVKPVKEPKRNAASNTSLVGNDIP